MISASIPNFDKTSSTSLAFVKVSRAFQLLMEFLELSQFYVRGSYSFLCAVAAIAESRARCFSFLGISLVILVTALGGVLAFHLLFQERMLPYRTAFLTWNTAIAIPVPRIQQRLRLPAIGSLPCGWSL